MRPRRAGHEQRQNDARPARLGSSWPLRRRTGGRPRPQAAQVDRGRAVDRRLRDVVPLRRVPARRRLDAGRADLRRLGLRDGARHPGLRTLAQLRAALDPHHGPAPGDDTRGASGPGRIHILGLCAGVCAAAGLPDAGGRLAPPREVLVRHERPRGAGRRPRREPHPPWQRDVAAGADRPDLLQSRRLHRLRAAAWADLRAAHPAHRAGEERPTRNPPRPDPPGARAPDRHGRDTAGHRQLGRRHTAGVRQDRRELPAPVCHHRHEHPARRRPGAGPARRGARPGHRGAAAHVPAAAGRRRRRARAARAPRAALPRHPRRRRRARRAAHRRRTARHRHLLAGHGTHGLAGPRHRRDHRYAPAGDRLHHAGAEPARDLRRPGGDRDPERAAVPRDAGGARTPDRDRRDPAGHRRLARRRAAGARRDRAQRSQARRRLLGVGVAGAGRPGPPLRIHRHRRGRRAGAAGDGRAADRHDLPLRAGGEPAASGRRRQRDRARPERGMASARPAPRLPQHARRADAAPGRGRRHPSASRAPSRANSRSASSPCWRPSPARR